MRKVKVIKITVSEIGEAEKKVNDEIERLAGEGKKTVSIVTDTFGVSPMYLIYTVIYEDGGGKKD